MFYLTPNVVISVLIYLTKYKFPAKISANTATLPAKPANKLLITAPAAILPSSSPQPPVKPPAIPTTTSLPQPPTSPTNAKNVQPRVNPANNTIPNFVYHVPLGPKYS